MLIELITMASSKVGTAKPDYGTYFSDPVLVKGYYIPTETLQLTNEQKQASPINVVILIALPGSEIYFWFNLFVKCTDLVALDKKVEPNLDGT